MIEVLHQDFSSVPSKPGPQGRMKLMRSASCSEPDIFRSNASAKLQRYLRGEGLPTERQGDVKRLLDSRHAKPRRYKNVFGMSAKCKKIVKWIGSIPGCVRKSRSERWQTCLACAQQQPFADLLRVDYATVSALFAARLRIS